MSLQLYRINDNEVGVTPIRRARTGVIETGVVFSVTLKDGNGDPISNLTGLLTQYDPTKQDNYVVFPGADLDLAVGGDYTTDLFATDAFEDKINFEDVPTFIQKRQ